MSFWRSENSQCFITATKKAWPRAGRLPNFAILPSVQLFFFAGGACMRAKLLQSCLTLCNPMVYSPSTTSVHGILQARILEWVARPYSKGSSRPRDWICISYVDSHWQAGSLPLMPPGKPFARGEQYHLLEHPAIQTFSVRSRLAQSFPELWLIQDGLGCFSGAWLQSAAGPTGSSKLPV